VRVLDPLLRVLDGGDAGPADEEAPQVREEVPGGDGEAADDLGKIEPLPEGERRTPFHLHDACGHEA
jgi:hypothetical protein